MSWNSNSSECQQPIRTSGDSPTSDLQQQEESEEKEKHTGKDEEHVTDDCVQAKHNGNDVCEEKCILVKSCLAAIKKYQDEHVKSFQVVLYDKELKANQLPDVDPGIHVYKSYKRWGLVEKEEFIPTKQELGSLFHKRFVSIDEMIGQTSHPNCIGIVGQVGIGKTTLSKSLAKLKLKRRITKGLQSCIYTEDENDVSCDFCYFEFQHYKKKIGFLTDNWVDSVENIVAFIYNRFSYIALIHTCCQGFCKAKNITFECLKKLCKDSFSRLPNLEQFCRDDALLAALHIINYQSLQDFRDLPDWDFKDKHKIIAILCQLLNEKRWPLLQAMSRQNETDFYQEKFEMLHEYLISQKKDQAKKKFITRCHKQLIQTFKETQCRHISKNQFQNTNQLVMVTSDGVVYDRQRDPPGQRSIYIPPGDPFLESYRLSTFMKFPMEIPVNPRHLASSGFYYTGYKDRVKCFSCGLCVEQWEAGDNVRSARWHQEDCKFLKGLDSGNVPVGGGGLARFLNPSSSFSTRSANFTSSPAPSSQAPRAQSMPAPGNERQPASQGVYSAPHPRQTASIYNIVEFANIPSSYHEHFLKSLDLRKESERILVQGAEERNVVLTEAERAAVPRQQNIFEEPPDPSENEQRDLRNMFQCQFPVNPHMRNEDVRFETFDHRWNANNVDATPRQIARAGFFFLGERDRVKCWYCNGGLQNWDPQDEPWTEHAKWFPTCEFLLQRKGPDFVHRMVSLFPNLPRPPMRGNYDVPPVPMEGERRQQFGRAPTPPPQIIDPQEELRREDEQVNTAMQSDIVARALEFGFELPLIRRVVKRRLRRSAMYSTVEDLVSDLTSDEASRNSDSENEEEPMESQPPASVPSQSVEEQGTSSSMQARIAELQDERRCKICLERLADIVFVPCGHLCCCDQCASSVRKCPMCRKKIKEAIRTYMS